MATVQRDPEALATSGEASEASSNTHSTKPRPTGFSAITAYLSTNISTSHADLPLILCCLLTGVIDASVYNAYSCFAAMQTGNTIFISLGPSHQPSNRPTAWIRSLTSVGSFCVSALISHRITTTFGELRRITLFLSFLTQALIIFTAAILVQTSTVPEKSHITPNGVSEFDRLEPLPIALLACQFGGQMVTSRLLGIAEIPTTVLTSVYCDLMIDLDKVPEQSKMDAKKRKDLYVKRMRRVGAVLGILLGGIIGGFLSKSACGFASALWLAGGLKFLVSLSWLVMKEKV